MLNKRVLVSIAIILMFSTPACIASITTVYIEIVGEAKFEVFYDRALSNATGAAIAGLIGAGIQSGVESSKDAARTKELFPLVSKDAWKTKFLDTLNDTLETKGFEAVWIEEAGNAGNGIVLTIYPEEYGYRIVNTTTRMMSAFIVFKAELSMEGGRKDENGEKEKYYITDKNLHPYDALLKEDSPVNLELEAVLTKAAKRLANKIIYNVKE